MRPMAEKDPLPCLRLRVRPRCLCNRPANHQKLAGESQMPHEKSTIGYFLKNLFEYNVVLTKDARNKDDQEQPVNKSGDGHFPETSNELREFLVPVFNQ